MSESFRVKSLFFRDARVAQFRRNVELVDVGKKFVSGEEGAIGLNFEVLCFRDICQGTHQIDPGLFLEQWFSAGEDVVRTGELSDGFDDLIGLAVDNLFVALEFRAGVVLEVRVVPIPGVSGVAPAARQVAKTGPNEYRRAAGMATFSLKGVEDFRTSIRHPGQFHKGTTARPLSPCR